jgi:hypothetical protein
VGGGFLPLQHPLKNRTDEGGKKRREKGRKSKQNKGFSEKTGMLKTLCIVNVELLSIAQ